MDQMLRKGILDARLLLVIFPLFHYDLHASRAINPNDLSINPFTILTSQEANYACNINWEADSMQWTPGLCILVYLIVIHLISTWDVLAANSVVHVSFDTAWCNAINCDLLVTKVYRLLAIRLT